MENQRPHQSRGSDSSVWDQAAASYDAERKDDDVYAACINQIVGKVDGGKLGLDAGCGTGLATMACAGKTDVVVAVDYSFDSLATLRHKASGSKILLVQADITRLPFRDGVFDYALCANTLQHLRPGQPQQQAVQELSRVTMRGGDVVVSVHHYSRDKRKNNWVKEGRPGQPGIDYIYRFTRAELAALTRGTVRAVGFYGLQRIPLLGSKLQNLFAFGFGRIAAVTGYGHMLIAAFRSPAGR